VDAVGPADLRCVAKFVGAEIEDLAEDYKLALDQSRCVPNLQSLRGIHDVVRRHAVVQPASGVWIADRFTYRHGEGNDVMLHARFQLVDACNVDLGAPPNCRGRFLWHLTCLCQSLCGCELYLQPFGKAVCIAPDMTHFLARIAWNQFLLLSRRAS